MKDCPDHGPWEDCPEYCPQFLAEVDRRIEDVAVHGNFIRTSTVDGVRYRQQFRNHQPVGEPVAWRSPSEKEEQ